MPPLSYDDTAITFIASKCDDVSCSEVIRALNLEDEPELEVIEERLQQYGEETKEAKAKKSEADTGLKSRSYGQTQLRQSANSLPSHRNGEDKETHQGSAGGVPSSS